MEIGFILLALALGVVGYAQLLHSLNLKAIEWQLHLSEGYQNGLYTYEYVQHAMAHPPWYVRLMKVVDVFAYIPPRKDKSDGA